MFYHLYLFTIRIPIPVPFVKGSSILYHSNGGTGVCLRLPGWRDSVAVPANHHLYYNSQNHCFKLTPTEVLLGNMADAAQVPLAPAGPSRSLTDTAMEGSCASD